MTLYADRIGLRKCLWVAEVLIRAHTRSAMEQWQYTFRCRSQEKK